MQNVDSIKEELSTDTTGIPRTQRYFTKFKIASTVGTSRDQEELFEEKTAAKKSHRIDPLLRS
jgi:hypothetical protein